MAHHDITLGNILRHIRPIAEVDVAGDATICGFAGEHVEHSLLVVHSHQVPRRRDKSECRPTATATHVKDAGPTGVERFKGTKPRWCVGI